MVPLFRVWAPRWVFVQRATAAARFHSYHDVLNPPSLASRTDVLKLSCRASPGYEGDPGRHGTDAPGYSADPTSTRFEMDEFPPPSGRQAAGGVHAPASTLAPVWSSRLQADAQSGGGTASSKQIAVANEDGLPDWPAGDDGLYANAFGKSLKMLCQQVDVGRLPQKEARRQEDAPIGSRA